MGAVQDLIEDPERHTETARAALDSCENGELAGAVSDLQNSMMIALKAIADAKGGAA